MKSWLHDLFRRWTAGERSLPLWLYGLPAAAAEGLYRAGAAIDRTRYPRPHPLHANVHLTVVTSPLVGGVGKSPLVVHLATALAEHQRQTVIMTRGYGRAQSADLTINPGEDPPPASHSGDEPLMLAQLTGCPVIVTADAAGALQGSFTHSPGTWVILDDGIRNRWQRERRIVVFADSDLESPVRHLPYGRWRVPPATMWPAAGVAITGQGFSAAAQAVHRNFLNRHGYNGPVGWYRRVISPLGHCENGRIAAARDPIGPPLAFCGLGMPERFFADVRSLGISPVATRAFPDHHVYTESDLLALAGECARRGGEALLTTHKDAVKFDPRWKLSVPVYVLRISLELAAGDDMLSLILE